MTGVLKRLRAPRRGQALVETALVLPLLLILTFGVVEMSLYMYKYVQAASCARESARRASVRLADANATAYCMAKSITVTVTPAGYATAAAGTNVVATATGTHTWLVLDNLIPKFPRTSKVGATVTMRLEGQKL